MQNVISKRTGDEILTFLDINCINGSILVSIKHEYELHSSWAIISVEEKIYRSKLGWSRKFKILQVKRFFHTQLKVLKRFNKVFPIYNF